MTFVEVSWLSEVVTISVTVIGVRFLVASVGVAGEVGDDKGVYFSSVHFAFPRDFAKWSSTLPVKLLAVKNTTTTNITLFR